MTKLEFIDKYIELLKQKIESSKESARLYYANDDYEFGKMEEKNRVGYEEELELFKQIKSDLEAWESVKDFIEIIDDKQLWFKMIWFPTEEERKKYKKTVSKVKKALGVK